MIHRPFGWSVSHSPSRRRIRRMADSRAGLTDYKTILLCSNMVVKTNAAKKVELGEAQLRAVADLFSVLSEPTRLRILQMLQRGAATVGEIMLATGIKQANASKQLGI